MYMRLESGTVCGNISSIAHKVDSYGKDKIVITGQFEGTSDSVLDCPAWIGDKLTEAGAIGQDETGPWVDSTKRIAIWKTKDNGRTSWGAASGDGIQTNAQFGQSRQGGGRPPQSGPPQQRPMTQRPPGAQSSAPPQSAPPQQQQRPTNGQPQQRPASAPQQPSESAEVTRRRIKATMLHCLKESAECWLNLGEAGKEVTPEAMQATAATIFIAYNQRQVPLLADPQAPPPPTDIQKTTLKEFREICHRIGMLVNGQISNDKAAIDNWFNGEIGKFTKPAPWTSVSEDQAKRAIDAMAIMIGNREQEIEKAKANYTPPIDPPPPAFTGDAGEIPF